MKRLIVGNRYCRWSIVDASLMGLDYVIPPLVFIIVDSIYNVLSMLAYYFIWASNIFAV